MSDYDNAPTDPSHGGKIWEEKTLEQIAWEAKEIHQYGGILHPWDEWPEDHEEWQAAANAVAERCAEIVSTRANIQEEISNRLMRSADPEDAVLHGTAAIQLKFAAESIRNLIKK